ncbi:MAG: [acyl-carrier-protein] S-malonyltransferase [Pirellulaceae bacterium]|jgi:[acyl-carrier-protein] S-malonyltransferase
MDAQQFKKQLPKAAFAFRGYNVTNIGRSAEMLEHEVYGPTVRRWLDEASAAASEILGRDINLVDRVADNRETDLSTYSDAIALIVGMELAQIEILESRFDISISDARIAMGYSLGEITALVAAKVISLNDALRVPLSLSDDCVALASGVVLAALFSKSNELPLGTVRRLCIEVNSEGKGVMGISAYLSPNSVLLMGQQDTLDRFKARMNNAFEFRVHLRKNDNKWPPLHTPIVWERQIPNRAAVLMHTLKGGFVKPTPPILSLVTGKVSYNDYNAREILHHWTDSPQRLWDAVYETLSMGIETVIHVGPQPNIMPATYRRLCDNVESQTRGRIGMRALAQIVSRPWLKRLLPERTALLRAPLVKQVILEDWLLDQKV